MLERLFEPTVIVLGLTGLPAVRIAKDKLSFILVSFLLLVFLVLFSILELRVRVNMMSQVTVTNCHTIMLSWSHHYMCI